MNRTNDIGLFIGRLVLSTVIAGHGFQKLFGWFGGYGFDATVNFFTSTVGLPYIVAVLIILTETAGMIALAAGLFSRILSVSLILILFGAIFTVHGAQGFFMNWSGAQGGEGYEYHLLAIGLASVISVNGSGKISLDALIRARLSKTTSPAALVLFH